MVDRRWARSDSSRHLARILTYLTSKLVSPSSHGSATLPPEGPRSYTQRCLTSSSMASRRCGAKTRRALGAKGFAASGVVRAIWGMGDLAGGSRISRVEVEA